MQFAVVRTQFEPVARELISQVLQGPGGLMRADANRIGKRSQEIVGDQFTAQQAQAIVSTLNGMGLSFRMLPKESLVELGKPRKIAWLTMSDQGVHIPVDYHDNTTLIPWSSIFVISAGHVAMAESTTVEVTPQRNNAFGGRFQDDFEYETRQSTRKTHITDIIGIAEDGQMLHVRLSMASLAFDRIQPALSAGSNLQRYGELVNRLVAQATHAVVGPATQAVINERFEDVSEGVSKAHVESKAFHDHNRWLLQMAVLQEMERQQEDQ